uniref:Uncharacterized protein n=1 Tax=Clandestinovirus TaxID=2831644 RepID=A0A8F8KNM4_9VIRU|nr:hypothetical protein KOM_12_192 [Clandestinovirus]
MATRCINFSLNSAVQRYKTLDGLKFKRQIMEDLKNAIFVLPHGPEMDEAIQNVKTLFFNVWRSPNYERSREYSLIQMNMIVDSIGRAVSPTCNNAECSSCDTKDALPLNVGKKLCPTLNEILTASIQELSKNIMESSVTPIVLEMTMKITDYLTDDEKQEWGTVIQKVIDVLLEAGWEGVGFSRAPNKRDIAARLQAIVCEHLVQ